ncbi:GWT1-domain-containing protein [Pterulicium gracile]|uniref:GPI-anchored wall transfer protein n=1 Tax=Pterulicium gracile TaxID=1884261 RepID=A0A5C3R0H0_9AGAR|nr:GWT1-domain-containing protein [Pterula gracilis]
MSSSSKKIEFVSGLTGSTVLHVNLISLVSLVSCITRYRVSLLVSNLLVSWLLLVFPLLLSMTLYAEHPNRLTLVLSLLLAVVTVRFATKDTAMTLPTGKNSPAQSASVANLSITPLPALSTYRANMMLMTVLAILAVDFKVFPRSLAKCESFGVSLMDMGVGSFVLSQGIVSAIPLVKNPSVLFQPQLPKLTLTIRKSIPVLLLGLVRVALVKGSDYHEHVSEYGVHWNFFITLGLLPSIQILLHPLIARGWLTSLALLVALAHQVALSLFNVQGYVLADTARTSIFNANKEGIISLPGYLAIHLFGLSLGAILLPPSPTHFRRALKAALRRYVSPSRLGDSPAQNTSPDRVDKEGGSQRQIDKSCIELFSYAVLFWIAFFLSQYTVDPVSRRMANLPYILWVAAYNASFILGYLALDMVFFPAPYSRSIYDPTSKLKLKPSEESLSARDTTQTPSAPLLLEAINKNGLVIFLLANVATGLINMNVDTLEAGTGKSMCILSTYALGLCAFAWAFRGQRIWRL